MSESVDIDLPAALWLAKLTPGTDPAELLTATDGCAPSHWFSTPLSTSEHFGGILSLADVGHGVEPNLTPSGSMPLPGDRIIIARTGRRVEAFGAVEVTGISTTRSGAVRLGHRPLIQFTDPVNLRDVRTLNRLLDRNWDQLFGRTSRDRRLLPLQNEEVALCFTAMGFSLEALFAPTEPTGRTLTPLDPWSLDANVDHIQIRTDLNDQRVADGVVAYHGVVGAFADHPHATTVDISSQLPGRDLLLTVVGPDHSTFVIAQSLRLGQSFRMTPTYRHLLGDDAATTLVAVETEAEWSLVHLTASETHTLHGVQSEQTNTVLRELGFLDS